MNKGNAINVNKIKIIALEWCVPHHTPSIPQQAILSKQILSKLPTELQYVERYVFMKEVYTQKIWISESGTQEGVIVPIWIIVGFQQTDEQNSQNFNNASFYRPPVRSAQCIIGTEKNPDSVILFYYNDDDYSQGYG